MMDDVVQNVCLIGSGNDDLVLTGGAINFALDNEVIIHIDKDGMEYKGERIEDVGVAHDALVKFLNGVNNQ